MWHVALFYVAGSANCICVWLTNYAGPTWGSSLTFTTNYKGACQSEPIRRLPCQPTTILAQGHADVVSPSVGVGSLLQTGWSRGGQPRSCICLCLRFSLSRKWVWHEVSCRNFAAGHKRPGTSVCIL